jgi:hypothetical protein
MPHTLVQYEWFYAFICALQDLCHASNESFILKLPIGFPGTKVCMSIESTRRVWKDSTKGGTAKLLLLALADWADDWGYCHPSIEQMAVKCRQTERNIINLIAELEQAGELRRIARGRGGRGKFSGSVYQVIAGMNAEMIATSQRISPLAQDTFAKLQNGEMSRPAVRNPSTKIDEKISGEKFSPEKQRSNSSPVFPYALKELINISDSSTPPAVTQLKPLDGDEQAEALYRLVRPTHLTLPNSEQRTVALKVLGIYLSKFGSADAAAVALKPFAQEADTRGIRATNLCWLSEWAAVGQIPQVRKKPTKHSRLETAQDDQTDYSALRKRMEAELAPHINNEGNPA